jgi:hypothetical protein
MNDSRLAEKMGVINSLCGFYDQATISVAKMNTAASARPAIHPREDNSHG